MKNHPAPKDEEEKLSTETTKWLSEHENIPAKHIIFDPVSTQSLDEFYAPENDNYVKPKAAEQGVMVDYFSYTENTFVQVRPAHNTIGPPALPNNLISTTRASSTTKDILDSLTTSSLSAISYIQSFYNDSYTEVQAQDSSEFSEFKEIQRGYQLDSIIEDSKREYDDTPSLTACEYDTPDNSDLESLDDAPDFSTMRRVSRSSS